GVRSGRVAPRPHRLSGAAPDRGRALRAGFTHHAEAGRGGLVVMGRAVMLVHGGAGNGTRERIGAARATAGLEALRESLRAGAGVLADGGSALDAVVAAVGVLEDAEELNAGRGAALTEDGSA